MAGIPVLLEYQRIYLRCQNTTTPEVINKNVMIILY